MLPDPRRASVQAPPSSQGGEEAEPDADVGILRAKAEISLLVASAYSQQNAELRELHFQRMQRTQSGQTRTCSSLAINERPGAGIGSIVWKGSEILCDMLRSGELGPLAGKRVLELGSGVGIAGIAAAYLGASVVVTDQESHLELLQVGVHIDVAHVQRPTSRSRSVTLHRKTALHHFQHNVSEHTEAIARAGGNCEARTLLWGEGAE